VILNPKRALSPGRFESSLRNAGRSSRRVFANTLRLAIAEVDAQRIDALEHLPGIAPGDDRPRSSNWNSARLIAH